MEKLVKLAKVFSDINRINILALVLRDKNLCVCEICDTLKLSQPLVSRHLKQMKGTNIFQSNKKGKWIIYSIVKNPDEFLEIWINEITKNSQSLPTLISCDAK